MTLTVGQRDALVRDSRLLYQEIWERGVQEESACLYHAVALQGLAVKRHGLRLMLQAGSASWPMIRPEDDDGVCPTHLSYEWQGVQSQSMIRFALESKLPELHCWLAHRDPDTIIDPTTGTWSDRARLAGLEWTAPKPPPYLWEEADALLEGWRRLKLAPFYAPNLEACNLAGDLAAEMIYPLVASALGFSRGTRPVR